MSQHWVPEELSFDELVIRHASTDACSDDGSSSSDPSPPSPVTWEGQEPDVAAAISAAWLAAAESPLPKPSRACHDSSNEPSEEDLDSSPPTAKLLSQIGVDVAASQPALSRTAQPAPSRTPQPVPARTAQPVMSRTPQPTTTSTRTAAFIVEEGTTDRTTTRHAPRPSLPAGLLPLSASELARVWCEEELVRALATHLVTHAFEIVSTHLETGALESRVFSVRSTAQPPAATASVQPPTQPAGWWPGKHLGRPPPASAPPVATVVNAAADKERSDERVLGIVTALCRWLLACPLLDASTCDGFRRTPTAAAAADAARMRTAFGAGVELASRAAAILTAYGLQPEEQWWLLGLVDGLFGMVRTPLMQRQAALHDAAHQHDVETIDDAEARLLLQAVEATILRRQHAAPQLTPPAAAAAVASGSPSNAPTPPPSPAEPDLWSTSPASSLPWRLDERGCLSPREASLWREASEVWAAELESLEKTQDNGVIDSAVLLSSLMAPAASQPARLRRLWECARELVVLHMQAMNDPTSASRLLSMLRLLPAEAMLARATDTAPDTVLRLARLLFMRPPGSSRTLLQILLSSSGARTHREFFEDARRRLKAAPRTRAAVDALTRQPDDWLELGACYSLFDAAHAADDEHGRVETLVRELLERGTKMVVAALPPWQRNEQELQRRLAELCSELGIDAASIADLAVVQGTLVWSKSSVADAEKEGAAEKEGPGPIMGHAVAALRAAHMLRGKERLMALGSTPEMEAVTTTLLPRLLTPFHRIWLTADGRRLSRNVLKHAKSMLAAAADTKRSDGARLAAYRAAATGMIDALRQFVQEAAAAALGITSVDGAAESTEDANRRAEAAAAASGLKPLLDWLASSYLTCRVHLDADALAAFAAPEEPGARRVWVSLAAAASVHSRSGIAYGDDAARLQPETLALMLPPFEELLLARMQPLASATLHQKGALPNHRARAELPRSLPVAPRAGWNWMATLQKAATRCFKQCLPCAALQQHVGGLHK